MSATETRSIRSRRGIKDITNDMSVTEKENLKENQIAKKWNSGTSLVKRPQTAPAAAVSSTAAPSRIKRPVVIKKDEVAEEKNLAKSNELLRGDDSEALLLMEHKFGSALSTLKIREEQTKFLERTKKVVMGLIERKNALAEKITIMESEGNHHASMHREEVASFKEQVQALQATIDVELQKVRFAANENAALQEQLSSEMREKELLEQSLEASRRTISGLETRQKLTESELATARTNLLMLEKDMEHLRQEIERRNETYQKEVESLTGRLNQESETCGMEKARLEEMRGEFHATATKLAVLEPQLAACKSEVERLLSEKEQTREAMNALGVEREQMASRLREMELRLDNKEAALSDTLTTMRSYQDMHAKRVEELVTEKDTAQAELGRLRGESDEIREESLRLKSELNDKEVQLRIASSELANIKALLEGTSADLNTTRERLIDMMQAKAEISERLAVVEAEFGVFKLHSNLPNMDQIERLCALEADKVGMKSRVSTCESELFHCREENKHLREENHALTEKVHAGEAARRKLHNELQELKGNIRVFARVRPSVEEEGECPLDIAAEGGAITPLSGAGVDGPQTFVFDKVFNGRTGQEEVFSEVSHFVQSALDGYNVVLFAYGQTGAGKTHTMIGGKNELRGIIPRSIEQILHVVERQSSNGWRFELEVSFLEIYNETIRDLLVDGGQSDEPREIKHGEHGAMIVTNLTSKNIASLEDVAHLMKIADKNRSYAKTDMNAHSSRSHSVFQLRIKGTLPPKVHGGKVQIIRGGLNLVDLAGSERLAKSNATGDRLRETQNINKSLSSLCSVFTAISAKQSHVPYRDSKLTYLLQPCLSGDGKALFIVNFSPAASSLHESICTLRFSSLISSCELGKAKRHIAVQNGDESDSAASVSASKRAHTATGAASAATTGATTTSSASTSSKRPQTAAPLVGRGDDKRFRS